MHKPRHIFRSIGAVLAGMAAGIILSLGTDIVLHAVGVFPPWGLPVSEAPLLLATAYRAVYMPCAWAGGKLRLVQLGARPPL
ncbi:MAG: hypothetical protein DMG22_09620 [Acidobacteria bacterium]|nr:MAG: hypothetical protein DMG22_09620 [Acidobacteriota bacterium]